MKVFAHEEQGGRYFAAGGGSSTNHGHTAIVFTLRAPFFTTWIFIALSST